MTAAKLSRAAEIIDAVSFKLRSLGLSDQDIATLLLSSAQMHMERHDQAAIQQVGFVTCN